MRRLVLAVLACAVVFATARVHAQGFPSFVVKDIRVEGLQRTEPGTVFSYLPIKVGESVNEERAQQALRALFATGFFRDVRLEAEGDVLVVLVDERPAIAQVDIVGVKEFNAEAVQKVLREQGMSEGRVFDRSVLENAEQELKRQYLSRGIYGAEVQTTVTPLERNRVGITIAVSEGDVAKIAGINIVGATAFSEDELTGLLYLRTPGWLTWYTKADRYARERLAADLEALRSHYQNRGYLEFNVESTQVSITPDRREIYITINITEGDKFTVSEVTIAGQVPVSTDELQQLIKLRSGDVFSRELLVQSTKAIQDRLGNDGYAFANANAVPRIDREKKTVAFTIAVDAGRRVYVRRIDITGNNKTRDEVVRRELRQLEGAYYDVSKIQLSRRRIDRTSYFADVTVDTQPVDGSPDQADVTYTVKEKPTGSLMFGFGFSSVDKFTLQASISQANIFGTGKFLSATASTGSVNQVLSLSYLDPYYTIDGVSQGFDVYHRKLDASDLVVGAYRTEAVGGGIKFGYPLSEIASVEFGVNMEASDLTLFSNSPLIYTEFANNFGSSYTYGALVAGLARDTRDSVILPSDGSLTRFTSELAGGDLQYYRLALLQHWFYPLSRKLTFHVNGELGYAGGYGGLPLPFFKNYYAGGPGSVRGYESLSLGPRDVEGNVLGGDRKLVGTAEILFPMPGADQDKSMRLSTFIDFGMVYGAGQKLDFGELRYAWGFGFAWASPFGPLRLSMAWPVQTRPDDRIEKIQFTLGTGF